MSNCTSENVNAFAKKISRENKSFLIKLQKKRPKTLDKKVSEYNDEEFASFDCLTCANCCKTISPRVTKQDIKRLSKFLDIKQNKFIEQYLRIDSDEDYVFKETPCPFLMEDNSCFVYESRPRACEGYPHTDSKNFYQLINITMENVYVCPIVYNVIEKLKDFYNKKASKYQ